MGVSPWAGHGVSLWCPGVSHGVARVRVYVGAAVGVMGLGRRTKSVMSFLDALVGERGAHGGERLVAEH
eukprot:487218-Prymnesium_polylepis.1